MVLWYAMNLSLLTVLGVFDCIVGLRWDCLWFIVCECVCLWLIFAFSLSFCCNFILILHSVCGFLLMVFNLFAFYFN